MSLDKIREAWGKLGTVQFSGSSLNEGWAYHEIPLLKNEGLIAHRGNTEKRIDLIRRHSAVVGKRVLDVGCSVGGISLTLADLGAEAHGIDYDNLAIDVAEACREHFQLNAHFHCGAINRESFDTLRDGRRFDLCIWFSQWMWVVHQEGLDDACDLLRHVSSFSDEMWFETGTRDGMAKAAMLEAGIRNQTDVLKLLRKVTVYDEIIDHGAVSDGWLGRPIFQCRHKRRTFARISSRTVCDGFAECSEGHTSCTAIPKERNFVLKVFKPRYTSTKQHEAAALAKLSLSRHFPVVVKETDQYLKLSHCGDALTAGNLPADHEQQSQEILDALKKHNILHRDVRPENLLVDGTTLKLIDFGWATDLSNPEPLPPAVNAVIGGRYRKGREFDDAYSLRASIDHITRKEISHSPVDLGNTDTPLTLRVLFMPAGGASDPCRYSRIYAYLRYLREQGIGGYIANYDFQKYDSPRSKEFQSGVGRLHLELLPLKNLFEFIRSNVLFMQDTHAPEWMISWGRSLGKRVVYDVTEAAYLTLSGCDDRESRDEAVNIRRSMRLADLVLVANEELLKIAAEENSNVRLLPSDDSEHTKQRASELANLLRGQLPAEPGSA